LVKVNTVAEDSHEVCSSIDIDTRGRRRRVFRDIGDRGYTQASDPNAAPNPYRLEEGWAKLPAGRKWGSVSAMKVDPSDGKSIWVFDRCGSNDCANSMIAPIQKFDSSGNLLMSFGAGMFNFPHGLYLDREGNVWATDGRPRTARVPWSSNSALKERS